MAKLPDFDTARLSLRPRTLKDLPACLAMDRDPRVTQFIPGPWSDPYRHEAFVKDRINADYGDGLGYWSVFSRDNPDDFLGWILLIPCDGVGPEVEIGWRFTRVNWGKGFATEAANAVLYHAIETLGLDLIIAHIHPQNLGSIKVALKLGMTDEGLNEHNGASFRSLVMRRGRSRAQHPGPSG